MDHLNNDFSFLRSKIESVKTALFKTEYNYRELIPNNVIRTLHTDDEGNIWFLTSVTEKYEAKENEVFYAYLEYHHKGSDVSLRIGGTATIVEDEDPDDVKIVGSKAIKRGRLALVKFKMMHADYHEYNAKSYDWIDQLKNIWTNFISASQQQRSFDLS